MIWLIEIQNGRFETQNADPISLFIQLKRKFFFTFLHFSVIPVFLFFFSFFPHFLLLYLFGFVFFISFLSCCYLSLRFLTLLTSYLSFVPALFFSFFCPFSLCLPLLLFFFLLSFYFSFVVIIPIILHFFHFSFVSLFSFSFLLF